MTSLKCESRQTAASVFLRELPADFQPRTPIYLAVAGKSRTIESIDQKFGARRDGGQGSKEAKVRGGERASKSEYFARRIKLWSGVRMFGGSERRGRGAFWPRGGAGR